MDSPMVAYAWTIPPPIPPSKPATAGLTPMPVEAVSISEAVKRRTAPLVEASIQAYASDDISRIWMKNHTDHVPKG